MGLEDWKNCPGGGLKERPRGVFINALDFGVVLKEALSALGGGKGGGGGGGDSLVGGGR